jgi:hypothetical protein
MDLQKARLTLMEGISNSHSLFVLLIHAIHAGRCRETPWQAPGNIPGTVITEWPGRGL